MHYKEITNEGEATMEIASVIKYEGDNQSLIWKHPIEDFNTKSQLIVHESQEAIFFMNGQALDSFGPGRHTLTTENIPLIRGFYHFITGDEPFHCEVYFINKVVQMAIKWGTDSKIQYLEPQFGFPIEIGACGEMNLVVENGRKLLIKLIGTEKSFTREELVKKFRSFLMVKIKPYLTNVIKSRKINIFEIDGYIDVISEELQILLQPDFLEYGIALNKFFLTAVLKPEGEKTYEKFKELYFRNYADVAEAELKQRVDIIDQSTEAQKRVIEAQSLAQKRAIEGYTYQEERSFDVTEKMAQNEGVGEFTNAGIGLGLVSGIGNSMGNATSSTFSGINVSNMNLEPSKTKYCTKCGAIIQNDSKFCNTCGNLIQTNKGYMCAKCGRLLTENDKFCPECGAKRGEN